MMHPEFIRFKAVAKKVSIGALIVVATIIAAHITERIDTERIKAQCVKHNAEYLEIGQEKLCVKEIK